MQYCPNNRHTWVCRRVEEVGREEEAVARCRPHRHQPNTSRDYRMSRYNWHSCNTDCNIGCIPMFRRSSYRLRSSPTVVVELAAEVQVAEVVVEVEVERRCCSRCIRNRKWNCSDKNNSLRM